jgi:hypothetical protein
VGLRVYLIPAIPIVIGVFTVAYGSRFPEYNDPNWEARLNDQSWFNSLTGPTIPPGSVQTLADRWYALQAQLRTPRDTCEDLGSGIVALGIAIAGIFLVKRVRTFGELADMSTPKTHLRFFLLAALTWLSFVPAEWCFYFYTAARDDYPPFADAIFIAMAGETFFGFVILPIVLFGVWIAIHNKDLPLPLWHGSVFGGFRIVNLGIWLALILAALVTFMGIISRPPIVLSCVFTIYLLLSGKAAAQAGNRIAPNRFPIWHEKT